MIPNSIFRIVSEPYTSNRFVTFRNVSLTHLVHGRPPGGTSLPCRTDHQVARTVAVNGTHRLPDALAPLINVRRGAEGDKQTPNVTNCH